MKKLGNMLIIFGVMLVLVPIIGGVYNNHRQKMLYLAYLDQMQQVEIKGQSSKPHVSEKANTQKPLVDIHIEEAPTSQDTPTINEGDVIGRIKIDQINLDLILVESISEETLALGAAHMNKTALPGQLGNCVIAGHRNYVFGSMFNRLGEVKVGDNINLETNNISYEYQVTKIEIVKPEDLSVLSQDKSVAEVTLITCHPIYSSKYRLIIKGQLVTQMEQEVKEIN